MLSPTRLPLNNVRYRVVLRVKRENKNLSNNLIETININGMNVMVSWQHNNQQLWQPTTYIIYYILVYYIVNDLVQFNC